MPGGDRTGPLGQGPMTGRAAGFCSGSSSPGYATPGFGRGLGRGGGRGFGRGFWGRGRGFWRAYPYTYQEMPPLSPDDEKSNLETMIRNLEEELTHLKERLQQVTKEK